jgi:ribosomal protein L37AE/L43A
MKRADVNAINNVRRKINEVMKKTDEKIVVGWRPEHQAERKEGETWVDAEGKEWIKKDGTIRKINKLDATRTPLFCPSCDRTMNHRLDTKFWRIRGHCFQCQVKEETKIRAQGVEAWKKYEEDIMKRNFYSDLKDFIQYLEDLYNDVKSPEYILADDKNILMREKWNVDVDKVKADIMEEIEKHQGYLRKFEEENEEFIRELTKA